MTSHSLDRALATLARAARRAFITAGIGCLGLAAALSAHAQEEPASRPDAPAQVAYPSGVTGLRDVPFSLLIGYRPITLDLYHPALQGAPKPVVVFAHGGAWRRRTAREGGTFRDFPAELAALAARGYVVASVNYRLSSEAKYPAQLHDMQNAIRWLRSHAADYNIDPERVVVWGSSAGSHLAALIGTGCGVAALEPPATSKSSKPLPSWCVQGVIDWYGPIDLEALTTAGPEKSASAAVAIVGSYLGCDPAQCKDVMRAANPISYIDASDPPFLIGHGSIDPEVPPQQSQMLHEALQRAGVSSKLILYPNVAHGFTKPPNWTADDAVNRQAMQDVVVFLEQLFPPKP
jgi:acetyl esterase/lipase